MDGAVTGGTVAVVLAAGSGERLGRGVAKALVPLRGRPMLHYSLDVLAARPSIAATIVVVPEHAIRDFEALVDGLSQAIKVQAVVPGGATRQESVLRGLEAVDSRTDSVVCHDAARPLATAELFDRVLRGLDGVEGCIPVVPSPDTVKLVRGGLVTRTLPRGEIGLAQTPQAFDFSVLRESHRRALREGLEATDDAMLVELAGHKVAAVEGESSNFKITTPDDLRRAEQILADKSELVEGSHQ